MAIAVPLLMAASGASAAIGAALGVSASLVTIGAGVLGAATGINAKIDKAASKVFGKDLVNLANLAGVAYMAFGSGPGSLESLSKAAGTTVPGPFQTTTVPLDAVDAALVDSGAGAMGAAGDAAAAAGGLSNIDGAIQGVTQATGGGRGVLASAKDWFTAQNPRVQAATLQVGGGVLQGAASGYMAAKQAEEEREWQDSRDRRFKSGSGVRIGRDANYGPRTPLPYARGV